MLVDLPVRFKISVSLVNKIISKWVDVLYERLKFLIPWPPREIVQQNMPPLSRSYFQTAGASLTIQKYLLRFLPVLMLGQRPSLNITL